VVEQGECLSRIAHRYGIKDWKKGWNAPENEALRKKRKNPNVLLPGDEITVPGIDVHEIIVPTDQTHRIVVTNPIMSVEVAFRDWERNPMGESSYVISYSENGKEMQKKGQLGAKGKLQLLVHVSVRHIQVRFHDLGCAFELQVGTLDPVENADNQELIVSGLQARLAALGYGACDAPGVFGAGTKQALHAFQQAEMSEEACTGEADSATRSKLVAVYGV
jgi:N-acetylmuramoyl-L-alanine amidase